MGRIKYAKEIKSKRESWKKYSKEKTKAFTFRLSRLRDAELINFISTLQQKTDTFRLLFTEYMKKCDRD